MCLLLLVTAVKNSFHFVNIQVNKLNDEDMSNDKIKKETRRQQTIEKLRRARKEWEKDWKAEFRELKYYE